MDEVGKIIAEGNALTRSLAVIETGASPTEARHFCSSYLEQHDIDGLEALIIDGALRKICGLRRVKYVIPCIEPSNCLEELLFREGCARWMQWACNVVIPRLEMRSLETRCTSELNRMALTNWLEGVDQLRRGNVTEGRRYFRRATTLGGLYGTPSNPTIQWTYAASFFPDGP
jgi:hypothetical protein